MEQQKKQEEFDALVKEHLEKAANQIVLNIGGTKFYTSIQSLQSQKGSLFDTMLTSGEWLKDSKGRLFIDRDPALFLPVLNYLRNGHLKHQIVTEDIKEELAYYRVAVPPSGLLAHWKFEGNLQDSSGTNHGKIGAGLVVYGSEGGHQYMQLDGSAYVDVPVLPIFDSSFTIATWVSLANKNNGGNYIFAGWQHPHAFRLTYVGGSINFSCAIAPGDVYFSFVVDFSVHTWYHITLVWDREDQTFVLYLNGKEVSKKEEQRFTIQKGAPNFQIGRKLDSPGPFFTGKISDLAVFNRSLNVDAVNALMQGKLIPFCY